MNIFKMIFSAPGAPASTEDPEQVAALALALKTKQDALVRRLRIERPFYARRFLVRHPNP